MRKAKLMLTAIGLLSLVGGALAFKATRVTGTWWCSTQPSPKSLCTIKATTFNPVPPVQLYCTHTCTALECTRLMTVRTTI